MLPATHTPLLFDFNNFVGMIYILFSLLQWDGGLYT